MNRACILTCQTAAALLLTVTGCVKKSEYDALQVENQALQNRVDQTSQQLTESKADVAALQSQVQKLTALESELQKSRQALVQSQKEVADLGERLKKAGETQPEVLAMQQTLKKSQQDYKILLSHYDQFLSERRGAMVGRKYPTLSLEGGQVLQQAQVESIIGDDILIKHADGQVTVPLSKASPELRWDVCYDLQERKGLNREAIPRRSVEKVATLAPAPGSLVKPISSSPSVSSSSLSSSMLTSKTPGSSPSMPLVPASPAPSFNSLPPVVVPPQPRRSGLAEELTAQLAAQRAALNAEYQALAAKNVAALRKVQWNTAQPESNALLSTMSGSRAVLGISRLQMYRNAIYDTLQQLRDLSPAAR